MEITLTETEVEKLKAFIKLLAKRVPRTHVNEDVLQIADEIERGDTEWDRILSCD